MDFSLSPDWLAYVWQHFGPWDVDRYASPSNATCLRFNALCDKKPIVTLLALQHCAVV